MNTLLLMNGGGAASEGQGWTSIAMMVAIFAIFYFFMIRPQQKKQKEIEKFRLLLKPGDKVITAGGIHGKIKEVSETYFLVEVSDGIRIRIEKGSVFASSDDIQAKQ